MTTFVTALINLNEDRPTGKDCISYLNHFEVLANTGFPFHVFISSVFESQFKSKFSTYSNIYYEILELSDLETVKELQEVSYNRPAIIVENVKQSNNYNLMNNAKIEFVKRAIDNNKYNLDQFAWIDFGINYVIKNIQTYNNLRRISLKTKGIVIPTIWGRSAQRANDFNHINWRFAGGFFLGDKESLVEFYNLYRNNFKQIITEKGVLPCEASLWAYFEEYHNWNILEYKSDHNDTMLQIPKQYLNFTTTFVTALINPDEARPSEKSVDKYFEHFSKLVDSKISLHVFLSECYLERFNQIYSKFNNIFLHVVKLEDLYIYKEIQDIHYNLPSVRGITKDTKNYLIIQNSKVEFIYKAIQKNIFNNNQFAWIDFGIFHVVDNTVYNTLINLPIKTGVHIPSILPPTNIDFNNVDWRFLGGFLLGDSESLIEFCCLCLSKFKETIISSQILTWEVNYWRYLEYTFGINIQTYTASFNNSIILNIK